ncbi:MAG: Hsp20/alpha crystallin family protein [Bacilli bacterium]|nr:Hsp20/alpha crystallin family protein [Bacilli bacterium]
MTYNLCQNKSYFDPFFEAFFGKEAHNVGYLPMKTDVYESEKAYRLEMDIPGFAKENINIDFKEGYLTVSVKSEATKDEEYALVRRERFAGETSRQFYLGDIDEKSINASYKDGVLTIVAPKVVPEEAKPFKVEIK